MISQKLKQLNNQETITNLKYGTGYVCGLSLITPPLMAHNLNQIYRPAIKPTMTQIAKGTARMLPPQIALRTFQLSSSTLIKEKTNHWVAFGSIGVMQGFIYGHAVSEWSRHLNLPKSNPNLFRGMMIAAGRDMISQGIPFMMTPYGFSAVIGSSLGSTVLSQSLHNWQTVLQINRDLSYLDGLKRLRELHGWKFIYRGVEARIGMMLSVNALNYTLLSQVWNRTPT